MAETAVARRYAEALIQLAHNENEVRRFEDDIEFLIGVIKKDERLAKILNHPRIKKADKLALMDTIWKPYVHATVFNFMKLLIKKRRMCELDAIYEQYVIEMNRIKGVYIAQIETAFQLDQKESDAMKERLEKLTGLKLVIENKINPQAIGGVLARIGDQVIDWRVSRILSTWNEKLRDNALIGIS